MTKIREIKLRDERSESTSVFLDAKIDDAGDLVMEGQDVGAAPQEFWGDSDYEYWMVVKKDYKDTILLRLLKEKFSTSTDFMNWLKEKDIPYEFSSWV